MPVMKYRNRSVAVLVGLPLLGAGRSSDDSPANVGSSSANTELISGEDESSSGDDGCASSNEGETSDATFAEARNASVFLELEEEITIIPPLVRKLRVRAIDLGDSLGRTVRPVAVGTEQPGPAQRDRILAMGRYLGALEAQLGKTGCDEQHRERYGPGRRRCVVHAHRRQHRAYRSALRRLPRKSHRRPHPGVIRKPCQARRPQPSDEGLSARGHSRQR